MTTSTAPVPFPAREPYYGYTGLWYTFQGNMHDRAVMALQGLHTASPDRVDPETWYCHFEYVAQAARFVYGCRVDGTERVLRITEHEPLPSGWASWPSTDA